MLLFLLTSGFRLPCSLQYILYPTFLNRFCKIVLPDWRPYILAHQRTIKGGTSPSWVQPIDNYDTSGNERSAVASGTRLYRHDSARMPANDIPEAAPCTSTTGCSMLHQDFRLPPAACSNQICSEATCTHPKNKDSNRIPYRQMSYALPAVAAFMKISFNGKSHKVE
jgi:hypothetical protein